LLLTLAAGLTLSPLTSLLLLEVGVVAEAILQILLVVVAVAQVATVSFPHNLLM
jgi:hypothetical protein